MDEREVTTRRPDEVRLRALMASYQAGDLASFDQLYAMLLPPVQGYLRRQARDLEGAGDLVQETFLQIHRARHTYDPAYPVMPWVIAIARHVWLMQRRAAARRPQPAGELVDEMTVGARGEAAAYAERSAVRDALAALSADRRKPLVWHHLWGFSFREIAARLGIREDAAKLRSSRGMSELRRRLLAGQGRKGER